MTDQPLAPGEGLVRLLVKLSYDGTMFAGWARQANLRTVQREVEHALGVALHLGKPADIRVAGRTDAGVHARGQVIHVDIPASPAVDLYKLTYSLNGLLAADVRVHSVEFAPEGFDARFSAIARRYSYAIADGLIDPLKRGYMLSYWRRLDVDAMNEASAKLLGLHDFTTFCKPDPQRTPIRTLQQFDWVRNESGVVATLKADAFCHSMVRSLVGSVIPVGDGRYDVEAPRRLLDNRERNGDAVKMPAHPLVFEEVYYPPAAEMLARQLETRARRVQSDLER